MTLKPESRTALFAETAVSPVEIEMSFKVLDFNHLERNGGLVLRDSGLIGQC